MGVDGLERYLRRVEREGLPFDFRALPLDLTSDGDLLHLRRLEGTRFCTWVPGSQDLSLSLGALLGRDLCTACFPGAFLSAWDLRSFGPGGLLVLAHRVLTTIASARSATTRLSRGSAVSTRAVSVLVHDSRRLRSDLSNATAWWSAPPELTDELTARLSSALSDLRLALSSPVRRSLVVSRVESVEASLTAPPAPLVVPGVEYLVRFSSDVTSALGKEAPMLASEVLAAFDLGRSVSAMVLPGAVVNYLHRVCSRSPGTRLSFSVEPVPSDLLLRDTALALWDPAGSGPLSRFSEAVRAAELL